MPCVDSSWLVLPVQPAWTVRLAHKRATQTGVRAPAATISVRLLVSIRGRLRIAPERSSAPPCSILIGRLFAERQRNSTNPCQQEGDHTKPDENSIDPPHRWRKREPR